MYSCINSFSLLAHSLCCSFIHLCTHTILESVFIFMYFVVHGSRLSYDIKLLFGCRLLGFLFHLLTSPSLFSFLLYFSSFIIFFSCIVYFLQFFLLYILLSFSSSLFSAFIYSSPFPSLLFFLLLVIFCFRKYEFITCSAALPFDNDELPFFSFIYLHICDNALVHCCFLYIIP